MIGDLRQLYGDSVVVELVALPTGSHDQLSRHGRSLLASEDKKTVKLVPYSHDHMVPELNPYSGQSAIR